MQSKRYSANVGDTGVLQVSAAASVVSQALGDLLQHVRQYTSKGEPIGRYDQATDTIMTVTESIFSSMGDAGEFKRENTVEEGSRRGEIRQAVGGWVSPPLCSD